MQNNRSLPAALAVAAFIGCLASGCAKNAGKMEGITDYVDAAQAYEDGDRDTAIADALAATRANPALIMPRLLLGDIYREAGDYLKAVTHYEELVKLDPYAWSNFYKLGVSYQFLTRLKEAADAYQKGLKLNPDDANTNMNLGLVYLYQGNTSDAVTYCERATVLDPQSPEAFSNLGVALDARGEFPRAEAAYRQSLDLDPDNVTTLLNLGSNLIQQNKTKEAIDILGEVVQRQDSALHRKRYGDALARAGQTDAAINEYQLALKLDPKYYPAMNEIGSARIAQYKADLELDDSKRDEALAMWKQSLAINPNQPEIRAASRQWTPGSNP